MLTLRPTKMLAKRLGIAVPAVPPPVANRVADWCVHEFRDRGWRYLLFCHTATLYPLVIPARGVTDDDSLIKRSIEAMKTCLLGTELEFAFERWIVPELGAVQYAPIPDKAVLSSMNETIMRARSPARRGGTGRVVALAGRGTVESPRLRVTRPGVPIAARPGLRRERPYGMRRVVPTFRMPLGPSRVALAL
jgi:hypothetical protein